MLLDPETLELAPRAGEVLDAARRRSALQARAARLAARDRRPRRTAGVADAAAAAARAAAASSPRRRDGLARLAAAGVHPFSPGVGGAQPPAPLRAHRPRVRRGRPPPARVRAPGPRRGRRRRPGPGRLQRRSRPTCRCSLRWPPTPRSTRAATPGWRRCARSSPSCCPARACRPRSRAGRATPTALRWGAGGRALSRLRAPGGGSCDRTPATGRSSSASRTARPPSRTRAAIAAVVAGAGRLARRAARRGRAAAGRPELADRGEPLVGVPPRRRGHDGRPADRRAAADADAGCSELLDDAGTGRGRGSVRGHELERARGMVEVNGAIAQRRSRRRRGRGAGSPGGWRRASRSRRRG